MREILFRGKTKDGKWGYGNYLHTSCHWLGQRGVHDDWIVETAFQNGGYMAVQKKYAVDENTVGQYTGMKDKNGKKIFEGDILKFSDRLCVVFFNEACGAWDCEFSSSLDGDKTEHYMRSPKAWNFYANVIGNIFDNPSYRR